MKCIDIGDRIKFRAVSRWRKAGTTAPLVWRMVNGLRFVYRLPTVRLDGRKDFVVHGYEILAIRKRGSNHAKALSTENIEG